MDHDSIRRPFWVRIHLLGIPDRFTAIAVWWLLLAASIGLPIYCLTYSNLRGGARVSAAILLAALSYGSAVLTGKAVQWMDRHGGWSVHKPSQSKM